MALERRQFIGIGSGPNSEPTSFSGLDREIVVNTDKSTIRVFTTQNPNGVDLAKDSDLSTLADRVTANEAAIDTKQDELVSGVNIKTVNGESLKGPGNLVISGGSGANVIAYDLAFGGFTWAAIDQSWAAGSYPPSATHAIQFAFSLDNVDPAKHYIPLVFYSYTTLMENSGLLPQCNLDIQDNDGTALVMPTIFANNPSAVTSVNAKALLILLEVTDETYANLDSLSGLANS